MGCTAGKQQTAAPAGDTNKTLLQSKGLEGKQELTTTATNGAETGAEASDAVPEASRAEEAQTTQQSAAPMEARLREEFAPASQDKVTKVTSNCVVCEYRVTEDDDDDDDEDEDARPSGTSRTQGRKVTPWHGGAAGAVVDFADEETEEEEGKSDACPVQRKANRKATPWLKTSDMTCDDDEEDEDDDRPETEEVKAAEVSSSQAAGEVVEAPSAFSLFAMCSRACFSQEKEPEVVIAASPRLRQ